MSNPTPILSYKAVLYCDGGSRPTNPGPSGYGIHGYVYSDEEPKKGSGNNDWSLGQQGYVKKADAKKDETFIQVKPVQYLDVYCSLADIGTNNLAEVSAATAAIGHAQTTLKEYDIKALSIYTDNEGVVKAANGLLERWESLGWKKTNGEPLANVDSMKTFLTSIREFKTSGKELQIKWIASHNGHAGNESADQLATIGCVRRINGHLGEVIKLTQPDGYWKTEGEKHPLIVQKTLYMSTEKTENTPGEYYMGTHGKDDELTGKRMCDGYHAFVVLSEPDSIVEMVKQKQINLADGEYELAMLHMDNLTSSKVFDKLVKYGEDVLLNTSGKKDIYCVPKIPITRVLRPLMIGYRAIERCNELRALMTDIENQSPAITLTEITSDVFEQQKGKNQLKASFSSGFIGFEANVKVSVSENLQKVALTLGMDLPGRNALKKIEAANPKIYVLTWLESQQAYRYATLVKMDGASAIFCGCFTNLRYVDMQEVAAHAVVV